jgi:hypothetical protein
MMNVNDAMTVLATLTHGEIGALSDNDLRALQDAAKYIAQSTMTHLAKRKAEAEDRERHERNLAKRAEQAANNTKCASVEEVPEYKELVMLANLLSYSRKKNDGNSVKLENKIETILEVYGLNDKRVMARLINLAS